MASLKDMRLSKFDLVKIYDMLNSYDKIKPTDKALYMKNIPF